MEYDPNRPDYSSDYGIARALRGKFGIAVGLSKHKLKKSSWQVFVDPKLKEIRPFISSMLATGLNLDGETVRQLISMQEDLHNGIGRRRKKLAIGLHNSDVLIPPIFYCVEGPEFSFIPLGFQRRMTLAEIMTKTDTGRKYGHLLSRDNYPVLKDSKGTVLSMPPIINGTSTVVTEKTKNLFVDITGIDMKAMDDAMAIISEALADAGAEIHKVRINYEDKAYQTPDLKPKTFTLTTAEVNDLLGTNLTKDEIVNSLEKVRMEATESSGKIRVKVPRYRVDILHLIDLVEEVGYGYGFENLKPNFKFRYSRGGTTETNKFLSSIRRVMLGLGFQEVVSYSLMSRKLLYDNLFRNPNSALVVESPKSELYEYLRDSIAPSILDIYSRNLHEEYPQKVFEIGYCFFKDNTSETGVREELMLCAGISNDRVTYTEIRAAADTLLSKILNKEITYSVGRREYLINGRSALIKYKQNVLGYIGEINPEVLVNFGLRMPAALFEISITKLFRILKRKH